MKDAKLPDIGRVTTEIIDGLRIRLSRGGRSDGLPVLLTSPWPESIYAIFQMSFAHSDQGTPTGL